jgi:hypothetical protein
MLKIISVRFKTLPYEAVQLTVNVGKTCVYFDKINVCT